MKNSASFNFFGSGAYPESSLKHLIKNKFYKVISMDRKIMFYGFQINVIVEGGIEINFPSLRTDPRYYESLSMYWE